MSVELIGIVTVGVALAGVILTTTRGLRQDMARPGVPDGREDRRAGIPDWRIRITFYRPGASVWRTPRTHGAPGRVARGHQRTGGGQLGCRCPASEQVGKLPD